MWGRKRKEASSAPPPPLKDALRKARIDQAERSGVVIDLHDAEVARLEMLNEALDPLFEEIPKDIELFDRGISRGDTPRLWIDAVAHISMGRDKRVYRFLQETRYGRTVLAESVNAPEIVHAVTKYLAQRLLERERAQRCFSLPMRPPSSPAMCWRSTAAAACKRRRGTVLPPAPARLPWRRRLLVPRRWSLGRSLSSSATSIHSISVVVPAARRESREKRSPALMMDHRFCGDDQLID